MNQVELLRQFVGDRVPAAQISMERPAEPNESWWLDARSGDNFATVEWRPSVGFGLSHGDSGGYGEGPDEILPDAESAANRVVELLEA